MDQELLPVRRWMQTNIAGNQAFDPILSDVVFVLIPVTAFADLELGGASGLPIPQIIGQGYSWPDASWSHRSYYIVARPRIMTMRWSRINALLQQRIPIGDRGLQYDLEVGAAPGFSGIAITPDGRLFVYVRGQNLGEARFSAAGRSAGRQVARIAFDRATARDHAIAAEIDARVGTPMAHLQAHALGSSLSTFGDLTLDVVARSVLESTPGFVQRRVHQALSIADRARRMLPSRARRN